MGLYSLIIFLGLVYVATSEQCGKSDTPSTPDLVQSYIVGGKVATEGHFPWQVALIENKWQICGGTYVIGNDGYVKVVTAGHCLGGRNPKPSDYMVQFGMHNTSDSNSNLLFQAVTISRHSGYDSTMISNDIAVIGFGSLTPNDLSASSWAAPACLARSAPVDGEDVVVSGWGTTSEGGSVTTLLMYVWKHLMTRNTCEQTGNTGYLDDTMLCAADTGKDACQGDSGGPLMANRGGVWELVGVVSWGFGCGRDNYPGVYADVWYFHDWLNNNM